MSLGGFPRLLTRPFRLLGYVIYYLNEVVQSNLRVAKDVLSFRSDFADGVINVHAPVDNDIQLMLLMNMITMTPGTISLYYDEVTHDLFIHLMYLDEEQELRRKIKDFYLPFVKEVWS